MIRRCRRLPAIALLGGLLQVAAASGASIHGAASQPANRQQPPDVFRSAVDAVLLNVTVVNTEHRYVTDVEASEFSVFEDGVRQQLTFFSRAQLPIALSLLIDTSVSMVDQLPVAQEAAIGFVRHLRSQDVAQIVGFNSRVRIIQPFTNQAPALERAIRATEAKGATALYNAVYVSLKQLARVNSPSVHNVRRRAIVLLSDGKDTSSLVTYGPSPHRGWGRPMHRARRTSFCASCPTRPEVARTFPRDYTTSSMCMGRSPMNCRAST